MANRIQFRRDSSVNWATVNPVLSMGEPGLETDTNKLKVGNGITVWASLPYLVEIPHELINGDYSLVLDASGNITAPGDITTSGNITIAGQFATTSTSGNIISGTTNLVLSANNRIQIEDAPLNLSIRYTTEYIQLPAKGDMIFDRTLNEFVGYDGTEWRSLNYTDRLINGDHSVILSGSTLSAENVVASGNVTLGGVVNFADGTVQHTAYELRNIYMDGGGAGTVYEVETQYADGGTASIRFGSVDTVFDGNTGSYNLDGGGAA